MTVASELGNGPSRRHRLMPALVLFLGVLVIWEVVVRALGVPAYILPSPIGIAGELIAKGAVLSVDLGWTMLEAVLGFLVGSSAAFLAAAIFVHAPLAERAVFPWAVVLQTVPIVAIAPLLTIWFGFALLPKIVISAIICFFPVLVNTTRGLRSVSREAFELMNVLSARRSSVFWCLRLPSSLPYIFTGLRVAATLSVIGAIVAEFTGSDRGIGYVIVQASYRIDTRLMFAGITLSSLGGVLFFNLIGLIERIVISWPDAPSGDL